MRASHGAFRSLAAALAAMLSLVVAAGACGRAPVSPGAGPTQTPQNSPAPESPSPTPSPTQVATSPAPTALDSLAGFFSAASAVDSRIQAAALAINGGVHADQIVFTSATERAIEAADPATVAAAIPPGLPPALLHPILVVYNDLVSRRAAFREVSAGSLTPDSVNYQRIKTCLANGAPAAARYAADVTSARSAAAALPAFTTAAPASRAAGELTILEQYVVGLNYAGAGCGGAVFKDEPAITWFTPPTPFPWGPGILADGRLGDYLYFSAKYVPGTGWRVTMFAN